MLKLVIVHAPIKLCSRWSVISFSTPTYHTCILCHIRTRSRWTKESLPRWSNRISANIKSRIFINRVKSLVHIIIEVHTRRSISYIKALIRVYPCFGAIFLLLYILILWVELTNIETKILSSYGSLKIVFLLLMGVISCRLIKMSCGTHWAITTMYYWWVLLILRRRVVWTIIENHDIWSPSNLVLIRLGIHWLLASII